jgi:hypothetical protein
MILSDVKAIARVISRDLRFIRSCLKEGSVGISEYQRFKYMLRDLIDVVVERYRNSQLWNQNFKVRIK